MRFNRNIAVLSIAFLTIVMSSCSVGFRKQKYTNFRSKTPTYDHSKQDGEGNDFTQEDRSESDSIPQTERPENLKNQRVRDENEFVVRRIDKIMAYANMLIGISATFVLLGVIPVVRGGFSMDRLLKETYVRRDRTNSIVTIVLSMVGIAIFVLLAL